MSEPRYEEDVTATLTLPNGATLAVVGRGGFADADEVAFEAMRVITNSMTYQDFRWHLSSGMWSGAVMTVHKQQVSIQHGAHD